MRPPPRQLLHAHNIEDKVLLDTSIKWPRRHTRAINLLMCRMGGLKNKKTVVYLLQRR